MFKLAPSILAADFSVLGEQIKSVEDAGAEYLHLDIMDGDFVPNISFGLPLIQSIRKKSNLVFDVHLMISKPERYIEAFAEAGADIITVHCEASWDIGKIIEKIRKAGKKAAISLNPGTPVSYAYDLCPLVDMVLLMSVYPGFGGQKLIGDTLKKAEALRAFSLKNNFDLDIEMDGGITLDNVTDVIQSGVNVIVVGSSVFGADDIGEAVKNFHKKFSDCLVSATAKQS